MKKLTLWIVAKSVKDYTKINHLKVRARYGLLEGLVSIVINLLLFFVKGALGLATKSIALIADAIATTFVVLALISSRYGYTRIDGIAGILVSLIIIYSGYTIAKEAVNPLLGEAPSKEIIQRIEETAKSFYGVYGVHDSLKPHFLNWEW